MLSREQVEPIFEKYGIDKAARPFYLNFLIAVLMMSQQMGFVGDDAVKATQFLADVMLQTKAGIDAEDGLEPKVTIKPDYKVN